MILKSSYPNLFSPIKIGNLMLKNRIVATPVGQFKDKAVGGAGLIISSSVFVEPGKSSWAIPDAPYAFDKYQVQATRDRILIARQGGARVALEFGHAGQYARVLDKEKDFAMGPSPLVRDDGTKVVAMDEAMMEETIKWYGITAKNTRTLGFDMIFMHFGHGWLPAEFLSPLFNKRTDEYGGSFENRAKFPKRILEAVRSAVGPDFPIDMRISAHERVPGSIEFDDVLRFIKLVEPLLDAVHISAGLDINHEGNVHMASTNFIPHMPNAEWAAEVKRNVSIPVTVVGAIMTPAEAEELIASGKVDMVGLGRSLVADPDWPRKALEGRPEDIVPCLRCLQCYHISTNRWNVGCAVNPRHLNEWIPKHIEKAEKSKKVVIIGGGPGGIKAALTAWQRGHDVTLFEKNGRLGGALAISANEPFKEDLKAYLDYLNIQVKKSAIDVRLNTAVTPEMVKGLEPEALIIAVGASETIPDIPGIDQNHVVYAIEAIENQDTVGNDVVIIGGGTIGSEMGLVLSSIKGKNVTIVEITSELAAQGNGLYRIGLRQKMDEAKTLTRLTNTTCKRIMENEVVVENEANGEFSVKADTVIIATGLKANRELAQSFYGITPETSMIGDCNSPRKIMEATYEGFSVAYNI